MNAKNPRFIDLSISSFAENGNGVGIWHRSPDSSVKVQVPFSSPGDEVRLHLKRKKGIYQGIPLEWLQRASDHVIPRCKHFGACGGCQWQHRPYEAQLRDKEERVRQLFTPYLDQSVEWHPILPCPSPWYYRNKMELSFSSDRRGNRYLGLILYGTRGHVFQMEECHLISPWVAATARCVRQWWEKEGLEAYHPGREKGSLRTLTLREGKRTGDRLVMLTVSGNPQDALSQRQIHSFVATLRENIEPASPHQTLSIFLRIQQVAKGEVTQFYEMLLYGPDFLREVLEMKRGGEKSDSLQFKISPTAFFQPNTSQSEQLYSRVIELTGLSKESVVYDLYCGTGTLGISLAKQVKEVIGIEISPASVLDARENGKLNHLDNLTIHQGDVAEIFPELLQKRAVSMEDVVMVDPPRAGLSPKALKVLLELKAPKLTYISCNPITQAANLEILLNQGYRLKAVQPIDSFPQTIHVENIAVLQL